MELDLITPGLSIDNSKVLVQLAAQAYDHPVVSEAPADVRGVVNREVVEIFHAKTDTVATITEFDNAVVVTFRGTKDMRNFLTDAKAYRVQRMFGTAPVGIHAGFCEAIEAVISQVTDELLKYPNKAKFSGGHSLGGGLAKLCGVYLRRAGIDMAGIYTFGEPRSGDAALAKYANSLFGARHFRWEDEADCITRIPGWLMGNRHSGQDVFLDDFNNFDLNPPLIEKAISDAWEIYTARRSGPLALMSLLNDHHVSRYETKILQLT